MSGTNSITELVKRAKELRQPMLALTEKNGLWGFIHFIQKAKEQDILPIAGTNIITNNADIILLAENQKGYENICHVISRVHDNPDRSIAEIMKSLTQGVYILAHQKKVLKDLNVLVSNSHLFVEMRCGMSEKEAENLAREYKLELIATGDVWFLRTENQQTHKILRAIEKNTTLSQLKKSDYKNERHYFRSEEEMIELFPNNLTAINNTHYLAERCKTDWNFVSTIFPGLSLKESHQANKKLRKMVFAGAKKRYGDISDTITNRIDHEMSIICRKGFSPYFLVVYDLVKHSKASTIGRGSGAASIVSYCLFITQVDPIKYNLLFERFIHPERVDMPDIDIDFPWDERDDVLEYVFNKYGKERTAMVSSQVFMQPRSSIREVSKVFGLSNEEIKAVTKRIGYHRHHKQMLDWIKTDNRFKNLNIDETLENIIVQSQKILGAFQFPSVHPGGVIIVPDDMRKYVPVLTAPKGVQIVEWEKDQVEDSGLLKIDVLGNRSLAVVRDTLKQLKLYRKINLKYHEIEATHDEKTEELMKSGKTMGVFYIESPATRQLLKKAGVVDFEHVVIYSSIIRPAANRYTNLMLERIHGKSWKLIHPDLECLAESYGIMVYEEQVSLVAQKIAGFSYKESDYLRKVISRPALRHVKPLWKNKFFINGQKRGYSSQLLDTLWGMIESFSGYSFCKPHSASFAKLSFTCAYLKSHYPAEFLAAVISNQGGFYSSYAYLSEARRFGIKILKPHINLSELKYKGKNDKIRLGFMAINNLKRKTVNAILKERKSGFFKSLEDFFFRMDIDFSDAMVLTNSGCFAELEYDLTHKEIAFRVATHCLEKDEQNETGTNESFQLSSAKESLPFHEMVNLEIESFDFSVSQHPLENYLPVIEKKIKKAVNLNKYKNKTINLAGVFITRKITSTKNKRSMEFVTFEDETDIFECVMFPDVYEKYGDLLNWEKLFIIRGKVEEAWGVFTLTIEKLGSLSRIVEKMED